MDDDWPGARFRGATWVEFYGGPWDGTMVEEKEVPLPLLGKINVLPKGDGSGAPLGEYRPVGWADEELKIVKLEWHKFTLRRKHRRDPSHQRTTGQDVGNLPTVSSQPVTGTNGTPDQVVMNYLADMKAVELWAKKQRINAPDDWEPIKAKFAAVRERYCTPRALATEMATSFGDPPEFDPDRTRVVEVEATRHDRALVVTMETDALVFFEPDLANDPPSERRYEHHLHLIHGEWRLNSRTLNDLDGEPRIRGLL